MEYKPKEYFFNERTLDWGRSLSHEEMHALQDGEVFILLGKDGKPYSQLLMDSYGEIRERLFKTT
jgi:hypothetical protein